MSQRNQLNRILRLQLAILNDETYIPVICIPERLGKVTRNQYKKKNKNRNHNISISK